VSPTRNRGRAPFRLDVIGGLVQKVAQGYIVTASVAFVGGGGGGGGAGGARAGGKGWGVGGWGGVGGVPHGPSHRV